MTVITVNVVMPSVIVVNVIMLSVFVVNVIILSVNMVNVYFDPLSLRLRGGSLRKRNS